MTSGVSEPATRTYMSNHHHAISRQMDVSLDGVGADLDGAAEGPHGVLGEAGLVASVGHGLRETMIDARLGSRPRRWRREVSVLANTLPAHSGGKDGQIYLVGFPFCRCQCRCLSLGPAPCPPPVDVELSLYSLVYPSRFRIVVISGTGVFANVSSQRGFRGDVVVKSLMLSGRVS